MLYKTARILVSLTPILLLAVIIFPPKIEHAQTPAIELSCPAGATAIPQAVLINPATGKIRQLLCMDSSGNLNFPGTMTANQGSIALSASSNAIATYISSADNNGNIIFSVGQRGAGAPETITFGSAFAHLQGTAANGDISGKVTCSGSTVTKTFAVGYTATPVVILSDETTAGGAKTSPSTSGFTVTCTGASDVVDYFVVGNPN